MIKLVALTAGIIGVLTGAYIHNYDACAWALAYLLTWALCVE